MRVPDDFAKMADAEVVVKIQALATGKLEAAKKLAEIKEGVAEQK